MRQCVLIGTAIALLTGCAKHPDEIQPAYVSEYNYYGWTCKQLDAEYGRVSARYREAYSEQRWDALGDTWGVFLIGVPFRSDSGAMAREMQIAKYKGALATLLVLHKRQVCGRPLT